ncbi:hypothetical protein [Algoriphagus formosus]|uniref:Uncharacterized protein n=1 Tax=Algoriphagus formosus TaxID=2007308 RepID=A0A4V3AQP5_9BACT|nr:hypothetical protein [Algoriphagus aquimaris]TDK43477.1 hypothetical protein E1898_12785 [Algoriphagus aquimaris]
MNISNAMSTVELKSRLIKLVEEMQNEELLELLIDFLSKQNHTSGAMWDDISDAQKQEVMNSYEESERQENLVEKEKLFRFLK